MLILTRRIGEKIRIDHDIIVAVTRINGDQITLGIAAPQDVSVHRSEGYDRIERGEYKNAANKK